jgi:hypothetical protein
MATGIVNAGGSFGQFIFAPIAQGISTAAGWVVALQSLAVPVTLLALPAAWVLRGNSKALAAAQPGGAGPRARCSHARWPTAATGCWPPASSSAAFTSPSWPRTCRAWWRPASCRRGGRLGAGVLGLFNIVGSLGIGWAIGFRGGRWRLKSHAVADLRHARAGGAAVRAGAQDHPVMLVFAAVMGLTFLSTVPPTAGLVARFFGPAHMATLFGVVMLTHQLGGFLGAWLGGGVPG